MKLFLMRHGRAETFADSDSSRQLTNIGKAEILQHIRAQQACLDEVDCIIHSPYQRAFETAQLVAEQLNVKMLISSALWQPDEDPAVALDSLSAYVDKTPLIVTHMPLIAYVEAICCDGSKQFYRAFDCAELAEIVTDWPASGLGTLRRRLSPRAVS